MRYSIPKIVGCLALFRIVMENIYVNLLNNKDSLIYRLNIDNESYIFSWIVFLLFSIIISRTYKNTSGIKVSNLILSLIFYMSYIPTSIHCAFAGLTDSYFFIFNYYWILIFIFNYLFEMNRTTLVLFKRKKEMSYFFKNTIYDIVVAFAVILILITNYKLNGTIYLHFGLLDVYDLRSSAGEMGFSTLYSLLLTWSGIIFIPVAAISCFHERKYIKFVILFFIQLVSFSIAGHKMQLFIIPVGLIARKVLRGEKIAYLPLCFLGLGSMAIIETMYLDSDMIYDFIIRRVFFVPALLNSYYIEYFTDQSNLWFSEDMLIGRIINLLGYNQPYDIYSAQLIGTYYFGKSEMLANNGMFAYGYADAGIFGVTLSAISLITMLHLLNWISKDLDIGYSGIIVVIFTITLMSVSISTNFYFYVIPLLIFKIFKTNQYQSVVNMRKK